jgi:glycosyltransferase involved in cell wall biosynthesis
MPNNRVLFVTDSLSNGGAERQLGLLAEHLPPEWERMIWSLDDGVYAAHLRTKGLDVMVSKRGSRFDVSPAFSLWDLARRWRPTVIHSWGWMSTAAALPVCKALHIPLVDGTIRAGCKPNRRAWAEGLVMRFADGVIANSRAGLDAWRVDGKRGRVIYNGFDPRRLALARREPVDDGLFRVIMTGRMVREKDYPAFIQAARLLGAEDRSWRFVALGGGAERAQYMAQAGDLIDQGLIDFPEPNLEIMEWVNQANVGVLLTDKDLAAEGCSNSIMEYMACGLPVVCTRSGGNGEVVLHGQTGLLVPPGDAGAVAAALRELRAQPQIARQMGESGRRRLLSSFSVDALVQNTIRVYGELATLCV